MAARVLLSLLGDFAGLVKVGGLSLGLRWLVKLPRTWRECVKYGSLQPADRALGEGPFRLKLRGATAEVVGYRALSAAREIWARDVYLHDGFLTIPRNATVLDLGANMGVFTALALGHGSGVRVIAVEADPRECRKLAANIQQNRAANRVTIVNAFVGGDRSFQRDLRSAITDSPPHLSESELIAQCNLTHIDLLKCDIEGAEFDLLTPASRLLAMAHQIALEIHPQDGDPQQIIERLKSLGFDLLIEHQPPTLIVLGRRFRGVNPR